MKVNYISISNNIFQLPISCGVYVPNIVKVGSKMLLQE